MEEQERIYNSSDIDPYDGDVSCPVGESLYQPPVQSEPKQTTDSGEIDP